MPRKAFNRTWARFTRTIYEVDPLLCPKCQGAMRVIAFIEDGRLVRTILKHPGLSDPSPHAPPSLENADDSPPLELTYDESYSQLPHTDMDVAGSIFDTLRIPSCQIRQVVSPALPAPPEAGNEGSRIRS